MKNEVFGLINEETNTVESIKVAEKFNKRHADLLRSIEKQILPNVSKEFAERNITFCTKNNNLQNGKPQKYYNLTKDGFMMVGMSLTGKEAYIWKESFINEFNRIEKELSIMKDIVWDVVNGQKWVSQEQALKMAGVKHPRLFMKYLKGHKTWMNDLVFNRQYLMERQCNKHGDRWWKFSQEGFRWLLDFKSDINTWVEKQKVLEKERKVIPA